MVQRKELNFEGQNIYIGIDVHLKTWHVSILTESGCLKKHSQQSSAQALFEHLKKHYPNGNYLSAYEAGFSGFSTYYSLLDFGIECLPVHAADIPTGQYESVMKTDAIDSTKIARALKSGLLRGIYIPKKEVLDDRNVMRLRITLKRQLSGYKSRVKHLLYNNGVIYPECFQNSKSHWSKRYLKWVHEDVQLLSESRNSLDLLLRQVELFRKSLLEITRLVRTLSRNGRYGEAYENIVSIPGIGMITGMCLLTEIGDIHRFRNERQFASYLELVPTSHSSGEKTSHGEMTFRGNKRLGPLLVESALVAIRQDRALAAAYREYCKRMLPQEAIIRITRKLSNRILIILKSGKKYEHDRCY